MVLIWWAVIQQIFFDQPFGDNPAPDFVLVILVIIVGVGFPLVILSLRLVTEVRSGALIVGLRPFHRREIRLSDVKSFEVRKYRPIREYGGWGIRWSLRNGVAYNMAGNLGVQLELTDGRRILVGSQKPEELKRALELAHPTRRR